MTAHFTARLPAAIHFSIFPKWAEPRDKRQAGNSTKAQFIRVTRDIP
jgi:hypothetical protein